MVQPSLRYATNYLVDVHAGIIVDVEATPAHRTQEVDATKIMLERVEERFDITPTRLIGDTADGAAPILAWIVDEKKLQPHIPVWDKLERTDGTFGRSDFTFDDAHNRYICPAGKCLKPAWRSKAKTPFRYRASLYGCQDCALKTKCCPNMASRNIDRSPHEPARDVARAIAKTDAYQQSRKDRKKVETLFAHLKRILKLDRLRLRGPTGAQDEFLLAATAQDLRRSGRNGCARRYRNRRLRAHNEGVTGESGRFNNKIQARRARKNQSTPDGTLSYKADEANKRGYFNRIGQDQTIAVPQEPTFAVPRAASQQSALNHQNLMRSYRPCG